MLGMSRAFAGSLFLTPRHPPLYAAVLTNVVILHHCAANFADWPGLQNMSETPGWWNYILFVFTSVNASYFMNLFFFLSGFFVPKSFDKKGLYGFLFDRVKRLGIPFVVYTYFIGPYVYQGFMKLFFQVPFPGSTTNTGPTWFLNQLLMFNVVYAFLCGKGWSPNIKCPSLVRFFGISLAVGLLTGILLLFLPAGDFFFAVPQFWADFPAYPIYFFAGAVAQRNDWMESIKEKSRVAIYLWTIVSIILLAVYYFLLMERAPAALTSIVKGVLHKGILSSIRPPVQVMAWKSNDGGEINGPLPTAAAARLSPLLTRSPAAAFLSSLLRICQHRR